MQKIANLVIAVLVVLTMIIAGCSGEEKPAIVMPVSEKPVYVKTAKILKMDFERNLSVPATIKPYESVAVTAKVSGKMERVSADLGLAVKKGDLLGKIDDTPYRITYEKSLTAVKSAKHTLARLQDYDAGSGMQPQQVEIARSQFTSAKLSLENVEKTYQRIVALYENQVVAKADLDQIQAQYDLAREQYEMANSSYQQAERNWKYDVASADIALEIANNDYQMAKENLDYTLVTAPIAGIVSFKNITAGENIGPGSVLFNIVNIAKVYLETGISEKDIGMMGMGMEVNAKVDALGGRIFRGVLTNISPALDPQSKTYPVKAVIDNAEVTLKSGMFAVLEITLDARKHVLAVPRAAVFSEDGNQFIYIVQNGRAERKNVTVGYADDRFLEIASGLTEGEEVVVVGHDGLKQGSLVEVVGLIPRDEPTHPFAGRGW